MTHSLTDLLIDGLRGSEAPLLVDDEGALSRREFSQQAGAALLQLRAWGVSPGTRVALHGVLDRTLATAFVACLLEGIVVVPIDAELPPARKQQMLALAEPALLIDFATEGHDAPWPGATRRLPAAAQWPHALQALELPRLPSNAPCYVFFTSGTTGRPKGILGRRGGLAHFLAWEAQMLQLRPADRVAMLTRLSFDVVLRDLLLPVTGRATGCLPPARGMRTAGEVLHWLDERQVSVLHAVPSLAQSWLAAWPAGRRNQLLRHTLFAGEPLMGTLVARWREVFTDCAVHNLYGPTETTLAKLCARVPHPAAAGLQDCGTPLPDTRVLIVDETHEPLAPGLLGEVVIQTPHASLGYLDPREPAAANFRVIAGEPAYLTGDLGFIDAQGCLHLRGRKDQQVKINGVRVEPVGVAALLQAHPAVLHAAVLCRRSEEGAPQLLAYYTPRDGRDVSARDLRLFLAAQMPAAAVPSHFIALTHWPVTPNGKLDREQLPQPPARTAWPASTAPADALEQAVTEAMADVLRLAQVGLDDDFFALGGDSLAAAELCVALEQRGPWHLQPSALLRAPTPREIAAHLRETGAAAPPPIPPAPRQRFFALSPQQRRYLRCFLAGGNRSWCNMVALIDLPDGVDAYAVQHALSEIALRHNSLRLRFSHDARGVVQQSLEPGIDFALPTLDLGEEREVAVQLHALRVAEGERDIAVFGDEPLFRATLLQLPHGRRKLLWNVHHLVSDGRSQGLLAAALHARLTVGRDDDAPPPSIRDIAAWAQQRPGLAQARAHVERLFALPYRHRYLPAAQLCADAQRCHAFEAALPGTLRSALRHAAQRLTCTPYALFVAAHFKLLAALGDSDDLVVVTPLAGRHHPQLASTIGNFINLVPLRVRGLQQRAAPDLVAAVKRQITEAAEHQALQFDEVLDQLGVMPDADRNPLTGYSLNYMPQGSASTAAPTGHADRGYKLKYDLLFLIRDFSDAVHVEIQYRAGLMAPQEVEQLFAGYVRELTVLSHA